MRAFRFLIPLAVLILPGLANAGGSASWQDAEEILSQAPQIRDHLLRSLDISEVGGATRFGRHFEHLGGARIGPYQFEAKPRGASGDFQFLLVIETAATFLDGSGGVLGENDEIEKATDFREQFVSASLQPLEESGGDATGKVVLDDDEASARNRWIGDHWQEISDRESRIVKIEIEADDEPISGLVERRHHPQSGLIESIKVDLAMGDHGGISEEFFFWGEQLFFVLRQESYWGFDPAKEGRTIDKVEEERYYFIGGGVYRALAKAYSANSEESLDDARDSAKNAPLDFPDERPAELTERATKLLDAVTAEAVLAIYAE